MISRVRYTRMNKTYLGIAKILYSKICNGERVFANDTLEIFPRLKTNIEDYLAINEIIKQKDKIKLSVDKKLHNSIDKQMDYFSTYCPLELAKVFDYKKKVFTGEYTIAVSEVPNGGAFCVVNPLEELVKDKEERKILIEEYKKSKI